MIDDDRLLYTVVNDYGYAVIDDGGRCYALLDDGRW